MDRCLLLIDIQNDYFEGGKNPLVGSGDAAVNARLVLDAFRGHRLPVVMVQHLSTREGSTFFIPGTAGAEFFPLLKPISGEKVVTKHFPNSFRETDLLEYLQSIKVKDLVICGMMTHMCVNATTRAAKDLGFNCTLIGDACATKDLVYNGTKVEAKQVHYSFLAALSYFDATVVDAEHFVSQLNKEL
jgi:nicotinamidase-related amidase